MVIIKRFNTTNLENTFEWMQDIQLKNQFLLDRDITREGHQYWFEQISQDCTQKIYAIYFNDKHVGNVGLKGIDLKNKNAEAWIYIGDLSCRGRGVAKEALNLLIKESEGLRKIYCKVVDTNINSLQTFVKAGYQFEGFFKEEMFFKGKFINIIRLAILV